MHYKAQRNTARDRAVDRQCSKLTAQVLRQAATNIAKERRS